MNKIILENQVGQTIPLTQSSATDKVVKDEDTEKYKINSEDLVGEITLIDQSRTTDNVLVKQKATKDKINSGNRLEQIIPLTKTSATEKNEEARKDKINFEDQVFPH